jgi:phosphatidylinositol glycan class M
VTPLLLASGAPFWPTHLLWTLNPFVLNITTRGSPESIIVVLVVMLLLCLRNSNKAFNDDEKVVWETFAAITLAFAISWKIYPIIYVPAIWALLAKRYGWLGGEVWWFGVVTLASLVIINGSLWSMYDLPPFEDKLTNRWGQPFLEHTFLYHLTRLDHRHNFSPYFYPIYHSLFPSSTYIDKYPLLAKIIRHPLTSFLPQTTLVALAGFKLPKAIGIEGTMFFQTVIFVVFNKVVTSQVCPSYLDERS